MCRSLVEIDANDVRTLTNEAQGGFAADAAAGTDHYDNTAGEFLVGGHAAEFGLLEGPVFDVEGFLGRE